MRPLGSACMSKSPLVAAGFDDKTPQRNIDEARVHGLDIAELRIDQFSLLDSDYVSKKLYEFSDFLTIATIRTQKEGGKWIKSEADRLALFQSIYNLVDAIDIELSAASIIRTVIKEAKETNTDVIVSHHDFNGTPSVSELENICHKAERHGADFIKIATMVNAEKDIRTLSEFTIRNHDKKLIVIGMGSLGHITRLSLPALGSLITFSYIGNQTAPGQPRFDTLVEDLRRHYPKYNQRLINDLELLENV